MVENDEFRAITNYLYKDINAWLLTSSNTCRKQILRTYDEQKKKLIKEFRYLKCKIYLIVDAQTLDNSIAILRIVAKHLDPRRVLRTLTLAMRQIRRAYTSANLAGIIADVIKEYKVTNVLSYISIDNALTCNVLMQELLNSQLLNSLNFVLFP